MLKEMLYSHQDFVNFTENLTSLNNIIFFDQNIVSNNVTGLFKLWFPSMLFVP